MAFSAINTPVQDTNLGGYQTVSPSSTTNFAYQFDPEELKRIFGESFTNYGQNLQAGVNENLNEGFGGLNQQFGGLSQQLNQVGGQLRTLTSDVGDIATKSDVDNATSNVRNVSGQINQMQNRMGDIADNQNSGFANLTSGLGTLTGGVQSLQSGFNTGMQSVTGDLSDKISKINLNLSPVQDQLTDVQAAMSRGDNQRARDTAALEARMTNVVGNTDNIAQSLTSGFAGVNSGVRGAQAALAAYLGGLDTAIGGVNSAVGDINFDQDFAALRNNQNAATNQLAGNIDTARANIASRLGIGINQVDDRLASLGVSLEGGLTGMNSDIARDFAATQGQLAGINTNIDGVGGRVGTGFSRINGDLRTLGGDLASRSASDVRTLQSAISNAEEGTAQRINELPEVDYARLGVQTGGIADNLFNRLDRNGFSPVMEAISGVRNNINTAFTPNEVFDAYIANSDGLQSAFNGLSSRDSGYIRSLGYDRNNDGVIDQGEYGRFHYETHGRGEGRVLPTLNPPTPDPAPAPTDPAPTDPTPDPADPGSPAVDKGGDMVNPDPTPAPVDPTPAGPTLSDLIGERFNSMYGSDGILFDSADGIDVYDQLRAIDQRSESNPFNIEDIFSARNRAEEELRGLDLFERELSQQFGADALTDNADLAALRAALTDITGQAGERIGAHNQRVADSAALSNDLYGEATDILEQLQGSTDIRNLYGPNGANALRRRFSDVMTRAGGEEGDGFARVLGMQGDFDDAYGALMGRRDAALGSISGEAEALQSAIANASATDASALAGLRTRLSSLANDISGFGTEGTADQAALIDALGAQLTAREAEGAGVLSDFNDRAMGMVRDQMGLDITSLDQLSDLEQQLDLFALDANNAGASGVQDEIGYMRSRLGGERARLEQDAANVAAREAAERAQMEEAMRARDRNLNNPFLANLPDSRAFDVMTPEDFLRRLAERNANNGTQFQAAGSGTTPSAFSAALAALSAGG